MKQTYGMIDALDPTGIATFQTSSWTRITVPGRRLLAVPCAEKERLPTLVAYRLMCNIIGFGSARV
jgi:hypothetical protein